MVHTKPDSRSDRLRELANAIDTVADRAMTHVMSGLMCAIESEADKQQMSPFEAKAYAEEEVKIRQGYARSKALLHAFEAARLDLREDEAMFLEKVLPWFEFSTVDPWTDYPSKWYAVL